MILKILFFIILTFAKIIHSTIIAKSKLEICTNNSSNFDSYNSTISNKTNLSCIQKLVVTLSIENSKLTDTDYIEAYISEIDSLDGNKNITKSNKNKYKQKCSKYRIS